MLSREALLFSPTREGVPSSDDNFTAADLVAAQDALEAEARETLPFSFQECTYDLGPLKQPLYACLTCLNNCAVCAACSISCHAEHQLVELFNRRNFRCDCGTERMGAGSVCELTKRNDAARNSENKYDKNFKGVFCNCGVKYDPHTETDSMYQCLICEDWLHHACLLGSHVDSADTPLGTEDFDQIVCEVCVRSDRDGCRSKIFERYAGREKSGVMMLDRRTKAVLGRIEERDEVEEDGNLTDARPEGLTGSEADAKPGVASTEMGTGTVIKREATEDEGKEDRPPKRNRIEEGEPYRPIASTSTSNSTIASTSLPLVPSDDSLASSTSSLPISAPTNDKKTCIAPFQPSLSDVTPIRKLEADGSKLHIFLEEGWMDRWCRCTECLPLFDDLPFFLEEEETYEPPDDPDAHKSTHEMGMEALARMPREQAIEGAIAFSGLSERLKTFLRPYSESGATITKDLIDQFFAAEREALAEQRR